MKKIGDKEGRESMGSKKGGIKGNKVGKEAG